MKKVAILQPIVPHYREEFFEKLQEKTNSVVYIYDDVKKAQESNFNISHTTTKKIASVQYKGILLYNPYTLCQGFDTLVLMMNFCHITTWILLLTKFIHRKKIILWGQGISVKRYMQEEITPDWKLKLMQSLSDGVWLYTSKEKEQWEKILPKKKIVALNNTISGVSQITDIDILTNKQLYKQAHNIKEHIIMIFCARFDNDYRRTDLLVDVIKNLDKSRFGFIIIGAGKNKPDFSTYKNVHDFGAVYDNELKRELFTIADIYFQPGWVGLSIVEAMAYAKPVFTFKRSEDVKQCVEYCYIQNKKNGFIASNEDEFLQYIESLDRDTIDTMGKNARNFVKENLTIDSMVLNAASIL